MLAERIGIIVSGINAAPSTYTGFYSWLAILLYPLQMYADFSGCMDIVLGTSELFGIKLAENFNNPFFSRTSQEFWQRWHITLGTWAKDLVLYPLLKSKLMIKFGKFTKKNFGKKPGKFLVNLDRYVYTMMVMGIWLGGWRYIDGSKSMVLGYFNARRFTSAYISENHNQAWYENRQFFVAFISVNQNICNLCCWKQHSLVLESLELYRY